MDFARTLRRLREHFGDTPWAVVGGLALAAHGAGRLTQDVDILTARSEQDSLLAHLEALGYRPLHVSEGYSNHAHPDPAEGRLDVMYVDGTTADRLFAEARPVELFEGLSVLVPSVPHIVAMKLLAASNDPSRRLQELADIASLLRATGTDPESVRATFAHHDMNADWEDVRDAL